MAKLLFAPRSTPGRTDEATRFASTEPLQLYVVQAVSRNSERAERVLGFGTIVLILLLVTNAQTVFEEFIGSPVHDLAVLLILGRSILAIRSGVNIADVARRFKKFALAIGLLSAFGAIRLFGDTFGVAASQAGSFPEAWLKDMLIVVALVAGSVSLLSLIHI